MTLGRKETETTNLEHLLQMAVRTAQNGNLPSARVMVQQVLDTDKRNERAWLLMAKMAENEVDQRRFLETVLEINPRNPQAKELMSSLVNAGQTTVFNSMRLGIFLLVGIVVLLIIVAVIAIAIVR